MPESSSRQQGFTLVEIVIVIAILGVLASVAVPRYIDLREHAHNAATRHIQGAFASALNILHAEWLLHGSSSVLTNAGGWPVGERGGPRMNDRRCAAVWTDVLTSPPPVRRGYRPDTDGWGALGSGSSCTFVYQPDGTPLRIITYDTATGESGYLIL